MGQRFHVEHEARPAGAWEISFGHGQCALVSGAYFPGTGEECVLFSLCSLLQWGKRVHEADGVLGGTY